MSYTNLVIAETLVRNLNSDLRLFDWRFVSGDPEVGKRRHPAGHIPSVHYLHFDRDLAGPATARSG
jgi:3-mercaptopyruvate sulfurtransferase SseA